MDYDNLATATEVAPVTWDDLKDEEYADELPVIVVMRDEWGARPPTDVIPLKTPVTRVGVTFNSYSDECKTKEDCIKVLQGIQNVHMDEFQMTDIAYNWMVGGDGRVYERRGWKGVPTLCLENPNAHFTKMVDITYIGQFDNDAPEFVMYRYFINFIRENILLGNIIEEFVYW